MPREERRIVFTNAELQHALTVHSQRRQTTLPGGTILSVHASAAVNSTLVLTILDPEDGVSQELPVQPEFVAAALIHYCKELNVPLPRRAIKSLCIVGDNVCLQVVLPDRFVPRVKIQF